MENIRQRRDIKLKTTTTTTKNTQFQNLIIIQQNGFQKNYLQYK